MWWVLSVLVAVAVGVVCGRWAFAPPAVAGASETPATVAVAQTTVGTSVPMAVSAAWLAQTFGVGAAAGTLTSLDVADGATVSAGQRLYTVDLRPVVAGTGSVPSFRDLSAGASGADVAQLQQLLREVGLRSAVPDGKFDSATTRAVKAWQKSSGVAQDGVVRAGDVVYAATLPARVRLADEVQVGTRLAAGDVVLSMLVGAPEFVATVPSSQKVDTTLPIEVTFAGQVVPTVVSTVRADTSGNSILVLTRQDGSPVCGDQCETVPLNPREAVFGARQVVVPSVTGPGVPAAAVWFTPDGDPYLVTDSGARLRVTILGQGQGRVVLDGVSVGTLVVLADETGTAPTTAPTAGATAGS